MIKILSYSTWTTYRVNYSLPSSVYCIYRVMCIYFVHREESALASLMDLSRVRLIKMEDQLMIVEMLPPNQTVSNVQGQDSSEVHPSLSTTLSELSQPLRVTITFSGANKTSVARIEVCSPPIFCYTSISICLQLLALPTGGDRRPGGK